MKSDSAKSFIVVMLVLQAVSVACLWILNVLSAETSSVFAVLLAANLIAFATVVQVYRNPGTVEETPEPPAAAPPVPPSTAPVPATAPAPPAAPATKASPSQATR